MKIFAALILLGSILTYSQNGDDTLKTEGWVPSAVTGLNINQVAFSNWSQGGENSLAFTIFGNVGYDYFSSEWKLVNSLKIAYGRTKLGDSDFRTNDNEIYLENVLSYDIGWSIDPYFSNTLRTVVSKGYDYSEEPFVQIADFFDPGYLTQSLGFEYTRDKKFITRLGFAVQETFTNRFTQYSDDPETDEVETFKLETGIESVTETELTLAQNLLFGSKLRLFTRFDDIDVWDVRWDNLITAKVNDFVNVNLNVLLIYEKSQSLRTQIKEALQLGITYRLY
jgi:hypothetical protein